MGEYARLGCSGWSYDEWVGPLYRSAGRSKLAEYSKVFDTAEINSTFYRNPDRGTVFGWQRYTPEGFAFTAKIPQTVTHDKLIDVDKGAVEDLREYCALMEPLADSGKLRCLLIQLPPSLKFEPERTQRFFESLPAGFRYAVEFRNKSWMCNEAFSMLKDFEVAYTIVDEPLLPPKVIITSRIAYFRWHGRGKALWYDYLYSAAELEPWIPRLRAAAEQAKEVYGFFNNHFHGYAPGNCLQVLEMLGKLTPDQAAAKKRIEDFRAGRVEALHRDKDIKRTTLDDFG